MGYDMYDSLFLIEREGEFLFCTTQTTHSFARQIKVKVSTRGKKINVTCKANQASPAKFLTFKIYLCLVLEVLYLGPTTIQQQYAHFVREWTRAWSTRQRYPSATQICQMNGLDPLRCCRLGFRWLRFLLGLWLGLWLGSCCPSFSLWCRPNFARFQEGLFLHLCSFQD